MNGEPYVFHWRERAWLVYEAFEFALGMTVIIGLLIKAAYMAGWVTQLFMRVATQ